MLPEGGVGGRGREKPGLERWEERGCRQTRGRRRYKAEESAWAQVWSRTGKDGEFGECQRWVRWEQTVPGREDVRR